MNTLNHQLVTNALEAYAKVVYPVREVDAELNMPPEYILKREGVPEWDGSPALIHKNDKTVLVYKKGYGDVHKKWSTNNRLRLAYLPHMDSVRELINYLEQ